MKKFLPVILLFTTAFYLPSQAQKPSLLWAGSAKSQVSPGTQILNNAAGIVTDAVGNVFITGYFYGTANFDFGAGTTNLTSAGGKDIYLAKYDAAGTFIWAKRVGTANDEAANGIAYDGTNVIITGVYNGTVDFDPDPVNVVNLAGSGLHNSFIAAYNAFDGALAMAKGIYGADVISTSVTADATGNIYIAGNFTGNVNFDPGSSSSWTLSTQGKSDIFMAKYAADGTCAWADDMGGISFDGASAISIDPSGNLYLAGYFGSSTADMDPNALTVNISRKGTYDFFIAKYDTDGKYIWAGGIGGPASSVFARSIVADAAGVYVTGSFNAVVDFNPGAPVNTIISAGSTDAFIARYNAAGEYVWAKNIAGSGPDEAFTIAADNKGRVYVAGYIGGQADFDPGAGTVTINPTGFDIYVAKYDEAGNYVWAKNFGSASNSDVGSAVTVDASGDLYLAGTFTGSIDFDPNAGVTTLSTNPTGVLFNGDIFLAKYTNGGVLSAQLLSFTAQPAGKGVDLKWSTTKEVNSKAFIAERSIDGQHFAPVAEVAAKGSVAAQNNYTAYDASPALAVNYYRLKQVDNDGKFAYSKVISIDFSGTAITGVYPNPASSLLNVRFNPGAYSTVQLIGLNGKVLVTGKSTGGQVNFNIQALPAGTYMVKLTGPAGTLTKKIIKQ